MMMEGEAPGAVMPKRQRSESPSRTSASAHASPSTHGRRLEELTGSVSALAQAVCSVNGSAMNAVRDKWIESSAAEQGWRSRLMQCEEKLVGAYAHRTQSELGGLALSQQLSQQHEMIHHLQEAVKSTAANITQHVQSYISSDVATVMEAMQTQLDREVELNNALSSQVQELATSTVHVMHQHAANARQDALSSTEKDVYIARLRASLAFEQQHAARRIREVEALMRLVQHLAEKSRADLASREELQRARAHVRLLEGQLHLHDIAAAVLPADFSSSVAGVEAPSEELRRVAPHYFALRMLQHKDITLCELMDSWFEQEGRLMRAERATAEMKMHVEEMQRDATLVHQRYLEERQRREISDRRITEMVRERLRTGQGDAAVEELQQLRWSYSQVVDDAAQLAVSLKMAREELEASMKEVAEQQRKICTMVQDAKTDQVAMTLTELRTYYESTVKSLEVAFADVEMQRQLILRTNEELTASSEKTHAACVSAQANEAVALQRLHPTTTPPPSTTRNNSLTAAVEKVGRCVDVLENRTMHLQSVMEKLLHGATQRAETVRSHFQEDVRRLVALIGEVHARSVQDKEAAAHSTDNISQQVHEVQQSEYANMMRQVLMEAGRFVVEHLELTDVQRTSLLDTSLSDAQYVLLLVQRARDLSQERDALRRELTACHELIEANHLTVLERALMHEVSVEDAMSAAEAAEHIMALRAQVAALLHGRQQALNDVAELDLMQRQMERAANSAESTNIAMQEHVQRLKDALHSSLSREAALCEKMVEVQNHMDALVQQQTEARASGSSEEAEATAELRSLVGRLDVELHQMRDVVAAANKHSHDASTTASSSSSAIPSEAELAAQLARGGFHAIVSTLRGALMKVGLLKAAVERNTWEAAEAIGDLANTNVTCGPEVELIRTQKQLREVEEQLHAAEAENEKMMATNQRVLGIVKSLMGKNKALTEEAATWRAKVGELEQRAEQALCDKEVRLPGEPQVEVPLHPPQEEPHAQAQATMPEEAEEQSDANMMPQPPSSS